MFRFSSLQLVQLDVSVCSPTTSCNHTSKASRVRVFDGAVVIIFNLLSQLFRFELLLDVVNACNLLLS